MRSAVIGCLALIAGTQAVSAAPVGFDLIVSGTADTPNLVLRNTSASAEITLFSLTIGDTAYSFDKAATLGASFGVGVDMIGMDAVDGGLSTKDLSIGLTGFGAGAFALFSTEIDLGDGSVETAANYSNVLYDNADAANAVARATFSDGSVMSMVLADQMVARARSFGPSLPVFASSAPAASVPVPFAGLLMLSALGAMGGLAARRKRPLPVGA